MSLDASSLRDSQGKYLRSESLGEGRKENLASQQMAGLGWASLFSAVRAAAGTGAHMVGAGTW